MTRALCRTCPFVEPTGQGKRGEVDVAIGTCHGSTPVLTSELAGAFVLVSLDIDWCRHHPDFKLPTKRK